MLMIKHLSALFLAASLLHFAGPVLAAEVNVSPGQSPAAIQNQCRALPPGGVVRFMPGRHSLSVPLSELRGTPQAPIRIIAQPGAVLDGWRDKAAGKFGQGSGILLEKCENVVVEGLSITGFERGITLGNCRMVMVRANSISDVSNYGVMSYQSDGSTITENTIERSHVEHGIYVSGAGKQVTVSKNTIRDTHINGIHVNGVVVAPVISDNRLERIGSFPTKEGGAALTLIGGTSAPVVSGNTFKNIYGQGVTVDAPGAVIRNNTFESCAWSSILGLPHARNLRLEGNAFKDTKVVPLQLSGTIIPGLTASGDRFAGGGPVCEENESHKTYHLKDWQALGKDAR